MGIWSQLLGDKLKSASGEVLADSLATESKAVALYFSAHWCPPCRGFTPKLAEWYKADLKAKGLQVVFVSSDKDEKAFDEYFAEQPWLALPFNQKDIKEKLSKKFKVQGIPSLVILDSVTGKTITDKGRAVVSQDPKGEEFPWQPKSLNDLLTSGKFLTKEKKEITMSEFDGKKLGIYFSAHWCPPCRGFTPLLAKAYEKLVEKEKFDILFVSSDRDQAAFDEYWAEMPWKALPWEDRKLKDQLSSHFEVNGIPNLVLLDESRKVISANAVGAVRSDPECAKYPWIPPLIKEIDQDPEGIDECPSFVFLMEEAPEADKTKTQAFVLNLAKKQDAEKKAAEARGEEVDEESLFNFFLASEKGKLADRVRGECAVTEKAKVAAILMDIQDNGGYYEVPEASISEEGLTKLMAEFKAKKLTRKQMG